MTLQEQYIKALVAYGYVISAEQPRLGGPKTFSKKYVRLHHPENDRVYWIGRLGAVRVGKTVTGSFAMSDAWKAKLLLSQM